MQTSTRKNDDHHKYDILAKSEFFLVIMVLRYTCTINESNEFTEKKLKTMI